MLGDISSDLLMTFDDCYKPDSKPDLSSGIKATNFIKRNDIVPNYQKLEEGEREKPARNQNISMTLDLSPVQDKATENNGYMSRDVKRLTK